MDKRKTSAKNILVVIALFAVPVYTIVFGIKQNPLIYTLSKIGFHFGNRAEFILWGTITGILLTVCVLYIFQKAGYENRHADNFLALSYAFLILTVLVPNFKETMTFLFYIHITGAMLFAACLLVSVFLFIRHLYINSKDVFNKVIWVFVLSVVLPLSLLAGYGRFTGILEISFFVCMSAFLFCANFHLTKKNRAVQESMLAA